MPSLLARAAGYVTTPRYTKVAQQRVPVSHFLLGYSSG
jgi:hypothetical protein